MKSDENGVFVIPEKINGLTVTAIGENISGGGYRITFLHSDAYYKLNGNLIKGTVKIPESVTTIDLAALDGFISSIEVSEQNAVYSSIDGMLYNKDKSELIRTPRFGVSNRVIPNGVKIIKDGAFSYCDFLESVTIPESVIEIEGERFSGAYIEVSERNPVYSSVDGVLTKR